MSGILPASESGVSTHSRPKAAALPVRAVVQGELGVSTHSRPKAAAAVNSRATGGDAVSTHSRPKAAAAHT